MFELCSWGALRHFPLCFRFPCAGRCKVSVFQWGIFKVPHEGCFWGLLHLQQAAVEKLSMWVRLCRNQPLVVYGTSTGIPLTSQREETGQKRRLMGKKRERFHAYSFCVSDCIGTGWRTEVSHVKKPRSTQKQGTALSWGKRKGAKVQGRFVHSC